MAHATRLVHRSRMSGVATTVGVAALILSTHARARAQSQLPQLLDPLKSALQQINAETVRQQDLEKKEAAQARIVNETKTELASLSKTAVAQVKEEEDKLTQAARKAQEQRDKVRSQIVAAATQLKITIDGDLRTYRELFLGFAAAAIVCALLSSILSFARWSMLAGVCGLLTMACIATPALFGVKDNFDFYRSLSNQTAILLMETALSEQPGDEDVTLWKKRFERLLDAWGNPIASKDLDQLPKLLVQTKSPR
jgi:hypothetical protein